jgi:hypothetical protein
MDNDGTHRRELPKNLSGQLHVSGAQKLANPRRRSAPVLRPLNTHHVINEVHGEAMNLAQFHEGRNVASALRPKTEVGAHHDHPSIHRLDQNRLHKLLGRNLTESIIEGKHERSFHSGRGKTFDLLVVAEERFREQRGIEQTQRVTVESDDRRYEVLSRGYRNQICQNPTVTGVHPIELSDGYRARPPILGNAR